MNHSQVQEAFKNFDANGDGKITEEGKFINFLITEQLYRIYLINRIHQCMS